MSAKETLPAQELVQHDFERERFFRWLVIRLGIASAFALTGWTIYLFIIIRRLLH